MNSLSWLLYFAGVSGSISTFFGFVAAISGLLGVIMLFVSWADKTGGYSEISESASTFSRKYWLRFLITCMFFGTMCNLLPSKETVYAIAASEMGERVLTDPRVQQTTNKAFQALDRWLDEQIKEDDSSDKDDKK